MIEKVGSLSEPPTLPVLEGVMDAVFAEALESAEVANYGFGFGSLAEL